MLLEYEVAILQQLLQQHHVWPSLRDAKYLHLNDNTKMPDRSSPEYDRLYKIRPLLESIVPSFKSVYTPSMNISVDESIIGFKGRLSFIQYMPKKPTKWGVKAWVMADSSNGYVSNLNIYTGIYYQYTFT